MCAKTARGRAESAGKSLLCGWRSRMSSNMMCGRVGWLVGWFLLRFFGHLMHEGSQRETSVFRVERDVMHAIRSRCWCSTKLGRLLRPRELTPHTVRCMLPVGWDPFGFSGSSDMALAARMTRRGATECRCTFLVSCPLLGNPMRGRSNQLLQQIVRWFSCQRTSKSSSTHLETSSV